MTQFDSGRGQTTTAEVVEDWLDPHLPTMFSTWHDYHIVQDRPTIEAIIAEAEVERGFHVLDVACGSGIPTLTLAEQVGPTGRVTAVDPSPVFIEAVRKNARDRGLANVEAVQSSAVGLPFAPGSFDAATCHMGVMFFPDVTAGLERIRRVLRPGRRAAYLAWGPEEANTLFRAFFSVARPYLPPPPDDPRPVTAIPAPMRFAQPGSLAAELRTAGYDDVREETRTVDLVWPGNAETLWQWWSGLTRIGQVVSPDQLETLRNDLMASFNRYADGDSTRFSADVVIASGRAPA
jgi:SAM-dependent methyltransferase